MNGSNGSNRPSAPNAPDAGASGARESTPGQRGEIDATDTTESIDTTLMDTIGLRPSWLVVGGLTLVWVGLGIGGFSALPRWLLYGPLAVSLVAVGLPHGAVDHVAPARAAGQCPGGRWLLAVGVVYLVLGVVYGALWFAVPTAAATAFIALTWFHWGQGDLYALDALGARYLDGREVRIGTLAVRGGLPMVVPLLGYPGQYRAVVDSWVELFGSSLDAAWLVSPTTRGVLGGGFALLTIATLFAGWRRVGRCGVTGDGSDVVVVDSGDEGDVDDRVWILDAAETVLLWAFFLVVPPIFAVGAYFCVWHSLRHIARLVAIDPTARTAFVDRGPAAALVRTGRDALPLTVVALALLVGIGVVGGVELGTRSGRQSAAALYLVFVSVLTLPHVAIVTWMDRAESAGLARLVDEQ
ncbi:Brp/Blh family beta-carotene 15,15'-dioxygenase [Halobellus captivus]|uniref:Brp/Blh family beta-carotene 15,15'-dioxygenase n=1 Tax=Halobellus captivus TaxID=2592614 RepID=UPI00193A94BE|nr:Brp/Blh family beta-carotene 15,15'-dioxygenase [Halobellus captivus]